MGDDGGGDDIGDDGAAAAGLLLLGTLVPLDTLLFVIPLHPTPSHFIPSYPPLGRQFLRPFNKFRSFK